MESQPQNPEFRNNPENFHPCQKLFHNIMFCMQKNHCSICYLAMKLINIAPEDKLCFIFLV